MAKIALGGSLIISAGLLLGFFVFAANATRGAQPAPPSSDAIVALTGGPNRIRAAAKLLEAGHGRRLLISGVNRRTTRRDLRALTGLSKSRFACCVDVGYAARNTRGNADETRAWMIENGFRSLVVVTANYHMPRSLAELSRKLPGVRLHAHRVHPISMDASTPWWKNTELSRLLAIEYAKFLPAAVMTLAHLPFAKPLPSAKREQTVPAKPATPEKRPALSLSSGHGL